MGNIIPLRDAVRILGADPIRLSILISAELLQKKPTLKAKASMSFDRSEYDVRFRSGKFFENLGDKLILDDIEVDVLLVTN